MANNSLEPCHNPRDHLRPGLPGKAHRRYLCFYTISYHLSALRCQPIILLISNTNQVLKIPAEDNMNVQLKDITVTARDGRVSHLDQVYIRGSHVRFFIVPDMLR